jgi:hypothetical protein
MMGNTGYLMKKGTPLTKDWYKMVTDNLSNKYEDLKANPPQVPR